MSARDQHERQGQLQKALDSRRVHIFDTLSTSERRVEILLADRTQAMGNTCSCWFQVCSDKVPSLGRSDPLGAPTMNTDLDQPVSIEVIFRGVWFARGMLLFED